MLARVLFAAALLASLVCAVPRASACGGLACDRPPMMPDAFGNPPPTQSGEEIVYGMESDGSLVMSVRIFYQGVAPDFAWILPVPATPVITLGTDSLFDTLRPSTTPYFTISRYEMTGTCAADPTCDRPDSGFLSFADAGAARSDAALDAGSGPTVELMSTLGPYEMVVLTGGTGAEVLTWLVDHSYVFPAEFGTLLDAYAMQGSHFVALRLRGDASIDQIQPVTLTMPGTSPCLPIRLTALATQPDLPITAWFLADARAVSSNFSMLDPDWADLGLYTGTTSYFSYATRQIDRAGGHAFVTDYAGSTPSGGSLELPDVLDLATSTDPGVFLRELSARGYLQDPHILAILADYLVPPAGVMARGYYNCLIFGASSFFDAGVAGGGCGVPDAFDPMGAVTAIDQTITQPRHEARALLARHPFTTRLFTTMSADEMTLDPEFRVDPALHEVPAAREASQTVTCDPGHYLDEAGGFYTTSRGVVFGAYPAQVHSGADAWCARHGLLWRGAPSMDGGRYPDGALAEPRIAAGGAGCSASGRGMPGVLGPLGLAWLAVLRVRRRRTPSP